VTTATPEEVLNFLKKAHDDFQPLSVEIVFDKTHALHRTTIALYGSILELTGACILLIDRRLVTGAPILLRAILEAYVDLVNLIENARYGYNLEVAHLKEWLKLLNEAKIGKNEYLADISKEPNLDSTIAKWTDEKRKLEAKGYRALMIEDKFRLAGMEKEYRSIYNSLCSDAHNNLQALVGRHIEREQADFSIVVYKAYTPQDSAHYVGINAEILMRATERVHEFFKSTVENKLPPYRGELNRLRGESEPA
jgi:hypothetical protein